MSELGSTCHQCGAAISSGTRFCGNCGASLAPEPVRVPTGQMRTMLGLDADQVRSATEAIQRARTNKSAVDADKPNRPVSDEARKALSQTMLGFDESSQPTAAEDADDKDSTRTLAGLQSPLPMPMPPRDQAGEMNAPRSSAPPLAAARPSSPPNASRPSQLPLGIAPPPAAVTSAPPAAPADVIATPTTARRTDSGAQTVLGMSPPIASPNAANAPSEVSAPMPSGVPLSFGSSKAAGTMLGINDPRTSIPHPAPVGQGRTMLGVPVASLAPALAKSLAPPPSAASGEDEARRRNYDGDRVSQAPRSSYSSVPPPPSAARSTWPLALAALVVIALGIVLVLRMSSRTPQTDVTARIVSGETGESLLFDVPRAPAGSKLRFGGQEQPLVNGHASFPLAADSLRVGDNVVLADVVQTNGETSSARITLAVFYRVWVDVAALRADRSALDVIVTAVPGTRVILEGEELKLDGQGHGTRSFPLDVVHEAKGGIIDHVVHYRMQPPSGETVVDELHTLIPVAMMQIDRPGRDVVTDRDSIEIAGAVGRDTQVRVDDTEVPVKDQRFLYRFPLPQPGDFEPRIVASATGKAPLGVTLKIKRVQNLVAAAREFVPDANLTYAKLAPNPTIYRGQSIALEGRVYAFDARAGSSVIQMLVRPCPSSQRCSVWVVDPQAGEVAVDNWVKVLGTVDGEQQFRSEKNEVVTVPKIVARFILPAKP